jgi:predicted RNase H-like nuclease (RuvC/YqgF family)
MSPFPQSTTAETIKPDLSLIKSPVVEESHSGIQEGDEAENQTQETDAQEIEESVDSLQEVDEESEDTSEFAAQFKHYFGAEPEEALSLLNELQVFRQEVQLMQHWNASPAEYQQRMESVRQFYQSLPENDREQFNSPEGAIAIWNHLEKQQGKPSGKIKATTKSRQTKASTKPLFTSQQIVSMSDEEYYKNLPAITQAFREGRVADR